MNTSCLIILLICALVQPVSSLIDTIQVHGTCSIPTGECVGNMCPEKNETQTIQDVCVVNEDTCCAPENVVYATTAGPAVPTPAPTPPTPSPTVPPTPAPAVTTPGSGGGGEVSGLCSLPTGECVGGMCPGTDVCVIDVDKCCKPEHVYTTTVAPTTTTSSGGTGGTVCADHGVNPRTGVSDCPNRKSLCNNPNYYALMTAQCALTCGRCPAGSVTPTPSNTGTCYDLAINAKTGVSDCPKRAALCNNPQYYDLMSAQCPLTCARCPPGGMPATAATPPPNTSCSDLINTRKGYSDCPAMKHYCNVQSYYGLMTSQCPHTCGRCGHPGTGIGGGSGGSSSGSGTGSSGNTGGSSSCVDLINHSTGVSDCPSKAHLCSNPTYYTLMSQQCPRTCGRCGSSSGSVNSGSANRSNSCVDLINTRTGVSDCPRRRHLCQNSVYYTLMTTQCPLTCGRCSGK